MIFFEKVDTFEIIEALLIVLVIYFYFKILRYLFYSLLIHFENSIFGEIKNKLSLFILSSIYTSIGILINFYIAFFAFSIIGLFTLAINWVVAMHILTIYYCFWKCFLYFLIGEIPTSGIFEKMTLDLFKQLKYPFKNKY